MTKDQIIILWRNGFNKRLLYEVTKESLQSTYKTKSDLDIDRISRKLVDRTIYYEYLTKEFYFEHTSSSKINIYHLWFK